MRSVSLPLCDALALSAAVAISGVGWAGACYVVTALLLLAVLGRDRLRICLRVLDEVPRLAVAAALPIVVLLPFALPAGRLLLLGAVSVALLVAMRTGLYATLRTAYRAGKLTDRVLVVGTGQLGTELSEIMTQHPELGLRPIGFIRGSRSPVPDSPLPPLGTLSDLPEVVADHGVSRVIVCFHAGSDEQLVPVLRAKFPIWVDTCVVPRMYEMAAAIPAGCLDEVWGIPLIPLRRPALQLSGQAIKRGFDLIVAVAILIALSPLLLSLVVAQLLCCGRPVLFRQQRVTRAGRVIEIIKLRTVSCQYPDSQWSVPTENCTTLGRWLRSSHLDELPQLVNVIRGDMSLVGPRPERPYFATRFAEVIPRYDDRHRAVTGMTGWAQVHGLTGDTPISERVRFDNYYIEHWSPWLDACILARTLAEPVAGPLRGHRARARTRR